MISITYPMLTFHVNFLLKSTRTKKKNQLGEKTGDEPCLKGNQLVSEIVQDRLEAELHEQVRKARKAVARQRKKTSEQLAEIRALPMPASDIIEAEVVSEKIRKEEEIERKE